MSTRSERPASAEQIHAALVALEAEPAAGPQAGPEGAREADRLRLLGSLLAKVELEITVATRLTGEEELEDVLETMLGWADQLGPDPGIAVNVLTNRLQRTALQVSESEADEPPPGREASFAAAMTAMYTLSAQLHADRDDVEGTRQALSGAEEALIDVMQGMHDLRIAIGDAVGEEEEPDS
ncbi:hypothetical protein GCM10010503_41790 [Streptomyces lucensis JCM 4490]|uniref:Uncharacterized protein n=1 Tax=Streptomyces lucensis JCM 4490 TaxID=1306176 RepID=A0A918J8D6_9ACTN|nr:hypothetical protein [Streptomyces lucensis]GGW60170.1 hypothetical protein GCM10010503_41790 [Streptomyces lucensis JCM 4490]